LILFVFSLEENISEKISDSSRNFLSYLPINFLIEMRNLMKETFFIKWFI